MTGPSTEEIQARMRPGAWSQSGFLGLDEVLIEVIAADAHALQSIGVTTAALAGRLDKLITVAKASPHRAEIVDGRFDVRIEVFRGFQLCPWTPDLRDGSCTAGTGVRHASTRWWIHNRLSGMTQRGPGLLVHLIEAHGFFEGRDVPDRVDPQALSELLELSPAAR